MTTIGAIAGCLSVTAIALLAFGYRAQCRQIEQLRRVADMAPEATAQHERRAPDRPGDRTSAARPR